MQMHQIRYFLALSTERNFTRAAKRCGVSQPSLTNAIIALERELGGTLFQRRPLIALTVLGHAIHPYLDRIAQNAEHARVRPRRRWPICRGRIPSRLPSMSSRAAHYPHRADRGRATLAFAACRVARSSAAQ